MKARDNVKSAVNWIIDAREGGKPSNFCRTVGVSSQKVNNWRKGNNSPDLETIGVIARIYGISLDWMIGGDDSKAPYDYYFVDVEES